MCARARGRCPHPTHPHQPVLPSPLARARAGARPIGRAHRLGPCPLPLPLPRPAVRGVLRALRGGRERGREGGGAVWGASAFLRARQTPKRVVRAEMRSAVCAAGARAWSAGGAPRLGARGEPQSRTVGGALGRIARARGCHTAHTHSPP